MKLNKSIVLLFVLLVTSTCTEPFDVSIPGGNEFLVVDGGISDQEGPYQIRLSLSRAFDQENPVKIENAKITVEEENGIDIQFIPQSDGLYLSEEGKIATAGNNYRLLIILENGEEYQSGWELLKPSPAIDSVYYRFDEGSTEEGFQIFVDTHDPTNSTRYYQYTWQETWIYRVPWPTRLVYLGDNQVDIIDEKAICWADSLSETINIATSERNVEDIISEHRLNFISSNTNRVRFRYSLLVSQHAVSEAAYTFFDGLDETSNEGGGLFDRQPQSLTGNMRNVTNPSEPVLGYFRVAGISTKRIYIDRQDWPDDAAAPITGFEDCIPMDSILFRTYRGGTERKVLSEIENGNVFVNFVYDPFIVGYLFTTPACSDCTVSGGTLQKPEYWIDE